MRRSRIAIVFAAALASSCSTVGTYEWNARFVGSTLQLRADHTFTFMTWSDAITLDATLPSTKGTWRRVDLLTVVTTAVPAQGSAERQPAEVWTWRLKPGGLISATGTEYVRKKGK
jgi:hypothetical protein